MICKSRAVTPFVVLPFSMNTLDFYEVMDVDVAAGFRGCCWVDFKN